MGVIGHPVGHSLSPRMHNAAFVASGMDFVCVPLDVLPDRPSAAREGAVALGFHSPHVTVLHNEIEVDRESGAMVVAGDRMLMCEGVQAQRPGIGQEPDVEEINHALA